VICFNQEASVISYHLAHLRVFPVFRELPFPKPLIHIDPCCRILLSKQKSPWWYQILTTV